jgi:hypothetical protein
MGTAVYANGSIYYIGGRNATAQNTVYYATVNNDYSLGTFNLGTALPQLRQEHATVVANGYLYAIGGSDGTNPTNTVMYAKMNGDGTIGAWNSSQNYLPANREASGYAVANGYVYILGGFDGTNRAPTLYYSSMPRTLLGGALDLVGVEWSINWRLRGWR